MKLKRFLSLLLVLCTLLTLVPASVLPVKAAEPEVKTDSEVHINPLYESVLSPSMFGNRTESAAPKAYDASEYISEAAAAKKMRKAMVDREYDFSVNFKTTNSNPRDGVYAMFDKAMVHTGNPKEGDYLLYTYGGWSASWSYYDDGEYYYISIDFEIKYYTTASQEAIMDAAVEELMEELDLDGKTDYQKVYAIYDYITETVRYDYANLNDDSHLLKYTGYAALVNKTAVCQGYANLFYRLALEADVDARIISGDGGGPHAWNIVALDGKYYNLDSTWDEGQPYFSWFLLSPDSFYNHYRDWEYETDDFHEDYPMDAKDYEYDPVKSNIQIDTQPKSVKVAAGETAKVTVKARGDGLTYQWYVKDAGKSEYTKSSNTTSTYSVKMTAAKSGRKVYCVIKDAMGNKLKTKTVTLTASTELKITTQPKGMAVAAGKTAKATVKASGNNLTYQWYVKDPGASSFTKSSNKTATYSVKMTAAKSGRQVYCVVKDGGGNKVKTKTVTLSRITISEQPRGDCANYKQTVETSFIAVGDGLTYQWYIKNPGQSKFSKSSVTESTYSYVMASGKSGRQAYCVIKDKYGNTVKTNTVTFSRLAITQQPKSSTVASGDTAKTTIKAVGSGLTYQWYVKNPGQSKFSKSSVKEATYFCDMTAAKSGRQAYCVVKDKFGNTVKSKVITLKVK